MGMNRHQWRQHLDALLGKRLSEYVWLNHVPIGCPTSQARERDFLRYLVRLGVLEYQRLVPEAKRRRDEMPQAMTIGQMRREEMNQIRNEQERVKSLVEQP